MPRQNIICLNCGKAQVRTNLNLMIDRNYVFLREKQHCPNCEKNTEHVATNNIKILKKRLTEKCESSCDNRIFELIQR